MSWFREMAIEMIMSRNRNSKDPYAVGTMALDNVFIEKIDGLMDDYLEFPGGIRKGTGLRLCSDLLAHLVDTFENTLPDPSEESPTDELAKFQGFMRQYVLRTRQVLEGLRRLSG